MRTHVHMYRRGKPVFHAHIDDDWKEEEHPREEHGRFTVKGAGQTSTPEPTSAPSASDLFHQETNHSVTLQEIMAKQPTRVREAIAHVERRLANVVATDAPVSVGGFKQSDGTWTEERQALHDEIIAKILTPEAVTAAKPTADEKPTYTILGGRGGSGKSWLTGENGPVDASKSLLIDNDGIKAMLPEYQGWNACQVHEEAASIFNRIDALARELGVNITHDATMKSPKNAEAFVNAYEDAGYQVKGYYMFLPPEIATERAISRFDKPGGRFVPPEYVFSSRSNEKSFDALKHRFKDWAIYNNKVERGREPELVGSGGN